VKWILLAAVVLMMAGCAGERAVLDGKKKTFVVVGYSTSFQWPGVVQKMLDEHAGEAGVYKVCNAAVSGSPVAKWLGMTNERDRQRTFDKMVREYFEPGSRLGGAPKPTVALCQQSLQWVFGEQREGIRNAEDSERIGQGADAFMKLAEQLNELGVERVYISTHIYKRPMEPEIENEKYALWELLKRKKGFILSGPELWRPTKNIYPEGFSGDKLHPNEMGARVMAVGWYRVLAGQGAKKDVIEKAERGVFDSPRRRKRRAGDR
jgi:hypothetical protein